MDNGDLSSMIGKIMSDPAFSEMLGRLKNENITSDSQPSQPPQELSDAVAAIAPMLSGIGKESEEKKNDEKSEKDTKHPRMMKHDKAQAEKLLYALKPYLSSNRCEIIDKCVSVMQLTDIVSAFGGIEGILKSAGI